MKRTMSANMRQERVLLDMDKDDEFFYNTDKKYRDGSSSVLELKLDRRDFETPAPRRERRCEEIKETDNDMTDTFGP